MARSWSKHHASRKQRWYARRNTRLLIVIVLGMVSLGVLAAITFPPAKKFAKYLSSVRHLSAAREAWSEADSKETLERSVSALRLQPESFEALQLFHSAAHQTRDPRSAVAAEMLLSHEEADDADRLSAMTTLVETSQLGRFALHYEALPENLRESEDFLYLQHRALLTKGQYDDLIEDFEERGIEPEGRFGLLLVRALYSTATTENDLKAGPIAAGIITQGLDTDTGEEGEDFPLEVVQVISLLTPDRLTPDLAAEVQRALLNFPKEKRDQIDPTLVYSMRIAAAPDTSESIYQSAVDDLTEKNFPALCKWLLRLEQHDRLLELIRSKPLEMKTSIVVYDCRISALIAKERYQQAYDELQNPPDFADSVRVGLARAIVARALDLSSEETGAWHYAMQAAEQQSDRNRFLEIAAIAQRSNRRSVAADAIVKAVKHRMGAMPPLDTVEWVIDYLIRSDRPHDLLAVCNRLLQGHPDNPVLLNNAIYLAVVLSDSGEQDQRLLQLAKQLYRTYPSVLGIRTTLALCHLACGEPEEALARFSRELESTFSWEELADSDRAIFAITLAENDDQRRFRNIRELINWDGMLTLERNFYRDWLRRNEQQRLEAIKRDKQDSEDGTFVPDDIDLLPSAGPGMSPDALLPAPGN